MISVYYTISIIFHGPESRESILGAPQDVVGGQAFYIMLLMANTRSKICFCALG